MTNVNSKQVGGTHYNQVRVQHWDLVILNKLPYLESQVTKYVTRWKKKHGAQDIEKSIHYLEKLQASLAEGVLTLPTETLTSIQSPKAAPPIQLEEFCEENKIGDIEKTIFYILLTYTKAEDLTRVGVLLHHLLAAAKEIEDHRFEHMSEGEKTSERVLALAKEIEASPVPLLRNLQLAENALHQIPLDDVLGKSVLSPDTEPKGAL